MIESVTTRVQQREEMEWRNTLRDEKAEADADKIRNAARAASVIESLPAWVRDSNPYNS